MNNELKELINLVCELNKKSKYIEQQLNDYENEKILMQIKLLDQQKQIDNYNELKKWLKSEGKVFVLRKINEIENNG